MNSKGTDLTNSLETESPLCYAHGLHFYSVYYNHYYLIELQIGIYLVAVVLQ
jgi:hypothetical protein